MASLRKYPDGNIVAGQGAGRRARGSDALSCVIFPMRDAIAGA